MSILETVEAKCQTIIQELEPITQNLIMQGESHLRNAYNELHNAIADKYNMEVSKIKSEIDAIQNSVQKNECFTGIVNNAENLAHEMADKVEGYFDPLQDNNTPQPLISPKWA